MRDLKIQQRQRSKLRGRNRCGTTAVEFAIVLPILLTITFGMLELSRAQTILGAARTGAFAGAREAAVAKSNAANVRAEIESVLRIFAIQESTITITPENFSNASNVTVQVQVPYSATNGMVLNRFMGTSAVNLTTEVAR